MHQNHYPLGTACPAPREQRGLLGLKLRSRNANTMVGWWPGSTAASGQQLLRGHRHWSVSPKCRKSTSSGSITAPRSLRSYLPGQALATSWRNILVCEPKGSWNTRLSSAVSSWTVTSEPAQRRQKMSPWPPGAKCFDAS